MAEGVPILQKMADILGVSVAFEHFDLGADRYLADGTTLPPNVVKRFQQEFDAIYLGAVGDPRVPSGIHAREILLGLRFQLDLYINLRPVHLLDESLCPLKAKSTSDLDFMVFRENTEGEYVNVGGTFKQGTQDEVAIQESLNTRKGVERIIVAAFEYARTANKKRVCMADKHNAMEYGHGLWKRVFGEVKTRYPEIQARHLFVDALVMQMVRAPEQFDVIVTSNLFGDIVTDLGAQLQGGMGLAASGNIHPGRVSLFEPVHGSAPDIAGQNKANPMASALTAGLLLGHLGQPEAYPLIEDVVRRVLLRGLKTPDLGGSANTRQVGQSLLDELQTISKA